MSKGKSKSRTVANIQQRMARDAIELALARIDQGKPEIAARNLLQAVVLLTKHEDIASEALELIRRSWERYVKARTPSKSSSDGSESS